jgi:hypothetical protein
MAHKGYPMPTISTFNGIKVIMYFMDNQEHHTPHFHVKYAEYTASVAIETGEMIVGNFPPKKLTLVEVWAELHRQELMMNWELACEGQSMSNIEPLR